jgi:DNA-binding NtrC family response regulator
MLHFAVEGRSVATSGPTVLLVKHSFDADLALSRQLAPAAKNVLFAHTPLAALWILERRHVDAVVCDTRVGTLEGRHLLEHIRDSWPHVARVLVVGQGSVLDDTSAAQSIVSGEVELGALFAQLPRLAGQAAAGRGTTS